MTQPLRHESLVPVLLALGGTLDQERWSVDRTLILGRDPKCDIVVPARQVSRRHARVYPKGTTVWVEDLGSKNGTFVNGERLEPGKPAPLKEGDTLILALAQRFVLVNPAETLTLPVDRAPGDVKEEEVPRRLRMDLEAHRVWVLGREIDPPLSRQQFRLLSVLYQHQGQVVPRATLVEAIWGKESLWVTQPALDALLHRLRERLAEYDPDHTYIVTLRGQGIRLDNPPWFPQEAGS